MEEMNEMLTGQNHALLEKIAEKEGEIDGVVDEKTLLQKKLNEQESNLRKSQDQMTDSLERQQKDLEMLDELRKMNSLG